MISIRVRETVVFGSLRAAGQNLVAQLDDHLRTARLYHSPGQFGFPHGSRSLSNTSLHLFSNSFWIGVGLKGSEPSAEGKPPP